MALTPNYAFPYPALSDSPNGPVQLAALAVAVDTSLLSVYNTVVGAIAANSVADQAAADAKIAAMLNSFGKTASVATNETTASAAYVDLATPGPSVTLTSVGTKALVLWRAHGSNNTANCGHISSFTISGATTLAAADANGILWHEHGPANLSDECSQWAFVTITPGTSTFKVQYKRAAGGTAAFERRNIMVFAP